MSTLTQEPATEPQIKQLSRVASDAAEKAVNDYFRGTNTSKSGAQRVHSSPDFAVRVREATILALAELSVTDQFKNEEVVSNCDYPSGYTKPKSITEQTNILRQIFPGVGFADEKLAEREVPANAEGWFAIPKWQTIAPTYSEAVVKVLDAIKKARNGKFYNYRDGQINEKQLRQSAKTASVFQKLGDEQKDYDILVVAAQFGLLHRGRSIRRAREVMQDNGAEFGLGSFAVAIMLLTHPERLQNVNDLWIDCAGDEFDSPASGARFAYGPYFSFHVGEVRFDAGWVSGVHAYYGSVSGFFPQ